MVKLKGMIKNTSWKCTNMTKNIIEHCHERDKRTRENALKMFIAEKTTSTKMKFIFFWRQFLNFILVKMESLIHYKKVLFSF
jgi:hypothetical protein